MPALSLGFIVIPVSWAGPGEENHEAWCSLCVGEVDGDKGRTDVGEQPSLLAMDTQPVLTVWGSLAAPDQKVLGPRACPCLPRLVKDRPATQGAGETGTS